MRHGELKSGEGPVVFQNVNAEDKDSLRKRYGWTEMKDAQLTRDPVLSPGRGEAGATAGGTWLDQVTTLDYSRVRGYLMEV